MSSALLPPLAPLALCLAVVAALVVAACGDGGGDGAAPGTDGGSDSGLDTSDAAPDGSDDAADTGGAGGPDAVDAPPDDGPLEICWNGHDDDGDGLLDCASPACAGDESCGALGVAAIDLDVSNTGACAVLEDGRVACWGLDAAGSLQQTERLLQSPRLMSGVSAAVEVAMVSSATCVLLEGGAVDCWGWDAFGQLGTGQVVGDITTTPVRVAGLEDAVHIDGGERTFCAVRRDGSVSCWGIDLSDPLADYARRPIDVDVPEAVDVSVGNAFACALLADGGVSCWGDNSFGQGGDRSASDSTPRPVLGLEDAVSLTTGRGHACAVRENGAVACWGDTFYGFHEPPAVGSLAGTSLEAFPGPGAYAVAALDRGTCVVRDTGSMECYGVNRFGQVGAPPVENDGIVLLPTRPEQVVGAVHHACARDVEGRIYCWGSGAHGQLGPDVAAGYPEPVRIPNLRATEIDLGRDFACAIREDDARTVCWGHPGEGQLGQPFTRYNPVEPQEVQDMGETQSLATGGYHACALGRDGVVYCWGSFGWGALGNPIRSSTDRAIAVDLPEDAVAVFAGDVHTCAIVESGAFYCWGRGSSGQLGFETEAERTPVEVPELTGVTDASLGVRSTCALTGSGVAICFGSNWEGQVSLLSGRGDDVRDRFAVSDRVVDIAAGEVFTCAIAEGGRVHCHGANPFGVGGAGIYQVFSSGTWPEEIRATEIDAGLHFACALDGDGRAWCAGDNRFSQRSIPNGGEEAAPNVVAGHRFRTIAVGGHNACGIDEASEVWCWGSNRASQLGPDVLESSSYVPIQILGPAEMAE